MTISLHKLLESDRIPSLPEIAIRVVELAQEPEPDFDEMIRTIKGDPAICSRIMRTVNSALFGLRQRVSSIDSAVPILGANLVRTLVLSFSLADHQGPSIKYKTIYQAIWRNCMTQAVAAEALAQRTPGVDESVWFLGALLQDIGRIVLLDAAPEEYSRLSIAANNDAELLAAEERTFGFSHVEVSTQLCLRWRLDNYLVDAVGKHHTPIRNFNSDDQLPADLTLPYYPNALRGAASLAAYIEALRSARDAESEQLFADLQHTFNVAPEELHDFLTDVGLRTNEVAALFNIDLGDTPPVEQILAKAQATLAKIAVQSQLNVASIQRHVDEAKQELENARVESSQWKKKAQTDDLTGALSRKVLEPTLTELLIDAADDERAVAVLFIDIDNFKSLNDNYGHHLGDEALERVVEVIRGTLRDCDHIVRYGGDEFVLLMATSVNETVTRVCERLRSRIEAIHFADEPKAQTTCSLGGVIFRPHANEPIRGERLIEEADQAMYLAKQRGGNRCALFELNDGELISIDLPETGGVPV
ncbi:MAG: GGDEF domain-containing protein [Planctomycetales bacterium]|nr:GGDEF domain-containing protein [Planctomycetales bacterium]